ncbi:DEAD-box ATP-dependent RNA helicase 50 [Vigna unguiculata]|uniref:ATP-dependent RNA helicase DDX18/HAS1 n=1 Tax=Vigna unguiculata TaxID=3917 RepID=A0A4D6NSM4_VIGUN|nr:DEAD-box ATP-dependent RNA helicase 50 [Vigna unguiculata]QCE16930.1 ATP-dependent RNA helicase DDX18/HAS1 [Vigna unguiculata]
MVVGRVVVLNPPSNLFHNPSSAASLIPPHTRLLSFSASAAAAAAASSSSSSANRTRHTPTTKNDSPFSTFGRVKTQKPKTLLHRSRDRRRTLQVEEEEEDDDDNYGNYDDNDDYSAPRRGRPSQSGSRSGGRKRGGWDIIPRFPSQAESTTDTNFFSLKSFKEIGCADYIIQSLQKIFLTRPSHVQAMAFAPVLSGKTCVIADQSGSGKTLAYLAPIIQRLRQEEQEGRSQSSSQAPRVLVLAPTAELASQVLDNCRSLSKSGIPFKSMVVTGGFRQRTQLENLQQGVDVLIATPGRFLYLMNEGFLQLTNLRCAVLDEVDILFGDEDFERALQCLINSSPVDTQYLFVTATLPKNVFTKLVEVFPDCQMIMGPGMHRISSRLEEILVDCSGEDGQEKTPDTAFFNKKTALLQLVEESPVPRTIVFCNKIETCRKVENSLRRFDRKGNNMQVLPFHAAMTQESRLASMEEFTRPPSKGVSQFMVCTDRASRGIDFAGVDHVILFDFPRDPSEYVRRVGRTARGARGVGKAFIFVVGKQVSLASKIMERSRKGHPLHDVPTPY